MSAGVVDATRSSVVAYYDSTPAALATLVARIRDLAADVGVDFAARPMAQVHATVIGLERPSDPARDHRRFDARPLADHLVAAFSERPLEVRFGGFGPDDVRLSSRGARLYDRSFSVRDGTAVLIGWPVGVDGPGAALAEVRRACEPFGVVHRHRSATFPSDPDAYLVLGRVAAGAAAAALEATIRRELAAAPVRVAMTADDLSLVEYTDTSLPRSSTRSRSLAAVAGRTR